ncbi:MAG: RICIN domain-containing protein, partial [Robiginitomaculum sp.]|nr:RICIN domain-containing protein [Robiginitomaculum sp.]
MREPTLTNIGQNMFLSNFKLLRRLSKAGMKFTVITCLFASLSSLAAAQNNLKPASVSAEDWQASGQDGIVALRLDGRVINIMHEQGRRYLRQGYGAARDDKRNVEASPPDLMMLPSRTKGFDWVLQSTGDGYYNIINLTTGLYLTLDSDDERNVSNWGQKPERGQTASLDATQKIAADLVGLPADAFKGFFRGVNLTLTDHQKWRFVLSDTQMDFSTASDWVPKGTHGSFRIYNKQNNQPLTMHSFGKNSEKKNVTVWPDPGSQAKGFDWALLPARDTAAEGKILKGNYKNGRDTQFISTSLASIRVLTIEKVRAIKVSTGQDDATKVLFAGIDLAMDVGMGVATGGATAAAKTSLKYGARALTKEALQAAAKAGMKAMSKKAAKKQLSKKLKRTAKAYGKAAATDIKEGTALEFAKLSNDVLDAMSSEAIFNTVYGESPDDFYIKVNGSSIFPGGGREHMDIKSQDTLIVNKSFVFDRFDGAAIQLMEYDSASNDDSLGEVQWLPYLNAEEGVYVEFGQVSALKNGKGYLSAEEREALPNIE